MAIEAMDFPIKNGGSFHSYVNVYQRVYMMGKKNMFLLPEDICAGTLIK